MAISVRPANLDSDRGLLIDALSEYLLPQSDGRRFDWLYRNNPHGAAGVWIATDGSANPILGAAAVFPRRMYVGGDMKTGCVLGDFFVVPRYRTLGPAVLLQRACMDSVKSRSLEFCYDFPAAAMVPVYKRLAIEPRAQLVRLAKLLKADRKIREWVKSPVLARGLSAVSNRVLDARDRGRSHPRDWTISVQEGACGEEFTALARAVSAGYGVCVERSAEYLNWRYRNHFSRSYELLTARRQGALMAYLVLTQENEDAEIVDLFGVEDSQVLGTLISGAVSLSRKRNAATLSAPMLVSHPRVALFESLGFRSRESCPVIVYPPSHPGVENFDDGNAWFLMQGDRES